jgi:hypothetical protein
VQAGEEEPDQRSSATTALYPEIDDKENSFAYSFLPFMWAI